ncbi:membrane protein insertion efficiency factor YidD [Salisediminibacterium selenitireducens]|uniref:Putative membrane protein insertion efficiency factor n=1 Tax=Bacillus selenitireducens (strain ATCC 700615 / DSM 15326 / MLS10) TaxID=439292 RepID=D6Y1L9_BACIE|nr:membrane protein insertion efficiency factor YidD [Salisediminibacterium selenitireducens]ADI00806.1 protein of unknown function DUF37 [[Bacillus] selenitireducens MLS10]
MFKKAAIGLIRLYQRYISRYTPPSCRFYPTCSQYGAESIERFGFLKGGLMTVIRILKCNPFHPGGFDPVPEKKSRKKDHHE